MAGLFVSSLKSGLDREKAMDMTQARLGVDDATMARIGTAAGRAYSAGFGESVEGNLDAARRAIQSGLLDSHATAQETQAVVEQLSTVSDLMGEEIPAVARAAGQAIKTGMADNATEAFDLFTAAERNGLNVSEDFLDSVIEYGTQFRKLGLSGQEAIGLINQAVNAGARDSDVAADAIKEFSIRVVDGSESTSEAFQTLGFNADDLTRRFATGGTTARAAVGDLLGEINKLEDPVKRNQISLALFGTQAEDLGMALSDFNLDTAVISLGKVSGAAQDAANTMSDNAASKIETAKRSIETSTDAISGALAKAFGPALGQVADWVTAHQPEIIGFFGTLTEWVFKGADAFLAFSSTSLRALASFAEGAGQTLESFMQPLGKVAELFGKLTGNEDLENLGKGMEDLQDKFNGAADTARKLADDIDNTARPKLQQFGQTIADNIKDVQMSQEVFRALGTTVATLPDGHTIELQDNTPETTARLEALGLKVTTLPNGKVIVTANTEDGQAKIDAFILANTGKKSITVSMMADWSRVDAGIAARQNNPNYKAPDFSPESGYVHYADGGIRQPGIADGTKAILWGEAGPEAYIPLDQSKRGRSTDLLGQVASMFGYQLTPMAAGGIVPGKAFAQSVDPAVYQLGGFSTSAMDCSGMVSATVNSALGRDPFESRMATGNEGEWLAARGAVAGLGGPGDISVGWTTNGAAGGHTAMTLSDGTNVEANGAEGVVIGGPVGANNKMFDQFMHIPAALLRGSDAGVGVGGTGAAGVGVGGTNGGGLGTGGGTAGGGTGTGGTFDASQVPAGVTPVWVVNFGTTTTPNADTSGATPASVDTTGGGGTTSTGEVQTVQQAWDSGISKLQSAGQNFLSENFSDALGTMGLRTSGGAVQEIVSQLSSKWSEILTAAIKNINAQQVAASSRYNGRG
ncbi:phage tail tape measure protein [Nocardia concava]|uniref:phage tail tape measure protein n=1 Tax=Nocardia concava TaxID=257281 RepID=UPI001427C4B4|nr:phage tail tape measure protein [Nocardia concava]